MLRLNGSHFVDKVSLSPFWSRQADPTTTSGAGRQIFMWMFLDVQSLPPIILTADSMCMFSGFLQRYVLFVWCCCIVAVIRFKCSMDQGHKFPKALVSILVRFWLAALPPRLLGNYEKRARLPRESQEVGAQKERVQQEPGVVRATTGLVTSTNPHTT